MVKEIRVNFKVVDKEKDVLKKTALTADSGLHNEKNMEMLFE